MRTIENRLFLKVMVLIILGIFLFEITDVFAAPPRGVLKQATHVSISLDWLDPATCGFSISAHIPMYLFHDALVKAMPEGAYTPCLAESWTVSPDTKVYEFKLRKGVKFHNGDTMTAEDVVFSFWRYKAGQAKFIHGKTEKVEAVNPTLVRFNFKEPFPDFLEYFVPGTSTIGWVVPKKYVEKVGEAGFKKHPVGAGPYKFVEFVPGVKLTGEAFEDYWRKIPHIKRIEFHTVLETGTRLAMAKRGDVDIATAITGVFYEDAKKDTKLGMLLSRSATRFIAYIASQWDPKSPWSDPRVRKAASLSIDRKTLANIHFPGSDPIGSLSLKDDPLGVEFPVDPYDPEGAKKLLAEAGYPKGFHGGTFYPHGSFWEHGEQVATYWKAIGITVDTVLLSWPAWMAMRQGGKMKGAIFIDPPQAPTLGGTLSYLLGPTSYGNYPDIQRLWDQYNREVTPEVRKDLIKNIQRLIHEKTMFILLSSSTSPATLGPNIKGNPAKVQPILWFTAPFEDIELAE